MMRILIVIATSLAILLSCEKPASGAEIRGDDAAVNLPDSLLWDGKTPLPDSTRKVSAENIYLNVNNSYGMQVFEMLDDGSVIISVSWGSSNDQYFERIHRDGTIDPAMHVSHGDHGDSMSVEETDGRQYVWFSSFCSKWYHGPQLLVRTEFVPGKSYVPEDFTDLYYYGNNGQGFVSVDDKNGLLAIFCNNHIRVFDLEEAKSAPYKNIEFSGESEFFRKAHDLTAIKPLASFSIRDADYRGYYNGAIRKGMQGFCVYKDLLYLHIGVEDVVVSVLDFNGRYVMKHVPMSVDDDRDSLIAAGLMDPRYNFEPEGVQVQDGHVYLGFTPFWNKILIIQM